MTKDKTLQELEGKIRELCPELMELSFGCEVSRFNSKDIAKFVFEKDVMDDVKENSVYIVSDKGIELINGWWLIKDNIIGHPITLESALKCLPNFAYSDVKGFIEFHEKPQHFTRKAVYWQLNKPLDQQQPEVIDFLHNLICTNDLHRKNG